MDTMFRHTLFFAGALSGALALTACPSTGGGDGQDGSARPVINAASCSYSDVSAAVSLTPDNGVVFVPHGSCSWSTTLIITKGLELIGAGAGVSIITSNVPVLDFDYCVTSIICYKPLSYAANQRFRVRGFTFNGGWTSGGGGGSGCVAVVRDSFSGDGANVLTKVRIDHNTFNGCGNTARAQRAIITDALTFGVIDHNTFTGNLKEFDSEIGDGAGWPSTLLSLGDSGPAITLGGQNAMYFEDNTITHLHDEGLLTSGGQGGRYVYRYNVVNTDQAGATRQHLDAHGTLGTNRGTPSLEVYRNVFMVHFTAFQLLDQRGGTGRIFQNRVIKSSSDIELQLREEDTGIYPLLDQITDTFYWGNTYGPTTGLEKAIMPIVSQGGDYVQLDQDYFTPPTGTEAVRPGTCAVNTYYATSDTDKLFKCTAHDKWTLYYMPYTYPHPLQSQW